MPNSPIIAVFDYDNTLVKGDSLWPFLVAVAGWRRCVIVLIKALVIRTVQNPKGDKRTFIKDYLLRNLLGGRRVDDLVPAMKKMKAWPKELKTLQKLREHHAAGHHIVIASGSLDLYLPVLLEDIPHNALICTCMEVDGGIVTGRMIDGNCVRKRKAELVANYLLENGPFSESWGYGNLPHDALMLSLVQKKYFV